VVIDNKITTTGDGHPDGTMTKTRPRRIPSFYPDGIKQLRDDQLLNAVRAGDTDAFGELYTRYVRQARQAATRLTDSADLGEDVAAAAFTILLGRLLAGNGPARQFWPDLLAQIQVSAAQEMSEGHLLFTDQHELTGACMSDAQLASIRQEREYWLVRDALTMLPERSRKLLHALASTGMSIEAVAVSRHTSVNLVADAAARATEALRVAYLQAHVPPTVSAGCVEPARRLAAWLCGRLPQRPTEQVSRHVADCTSCALIADELADLRGQMRDRPSRRRTSRR
jgi:DNA-directed RNA polymerase specialized sigma24 family protein